MQTCNIVRNVRLHDIDKIYSVHLPHKVCIVFVFALIGFEWILYFCVIFISKSKHSRHCVSHSFYPIVTYYFS